MEPYFQGHACFDCVHVHRRIVYVSLCVVEPSAEKGSIVQIVEQGQQRTGVASCIAVVVVGMQEHVVGLVVLQSAAATHIVQLYDEINAHGKGRYALEEYIRWGCVCGRYEIFFQQDPPSRHLVPLSGWFQVAVESDPEEATTQMKAVDAASRRQ